MLVIKYNFRNCLLMYHVGRHSAVGIATRYGWMDGGSNPTGGEIFRTPPDRPWGPSRLLYNGYRVSFPRVKRPGRSVEHTSLPSAEVKERVNLYFYSSLGLRGLFYGELCLYLLLVYYMRVCRGEDNVNFLKQICVL